jgi:hypothetical protein
MQAHRTAQPYFLVAVLAGALGFLAWSTTTDAATIPVSSAGMEKSKTKNVCSETARLAKLSCDFDAPSEYQLALGKCANLGDPTRRADCQATAKDDWKSLKDNCRAQFAARKDVCGQIGEAAYDVSIDPRNFLDKAGIIAQPNPFFPLIPGRTYVYRHGTETVRTTITNQTKQILGVTVIVVNDVSTVNGLTTEDTEDWFAQDTQGNVWYFGEIARQFANGELVGIDGSWKAGIDGAQPGIVMKATPQVGDVYRQEFALGEAEDMGAVLNRNGSATTPKASCNTTCLVTKDFSPLEPDAIENKYYAPGVGLILTVDTATNEREELIDIEIH